MRWMKWMCLASAAVMLLLLVAVEPAMAQGAPAGESSGMSMFEMFFLGGKAGQRDPFGTMQIWFLILLSAVNLGLTLQFALKYRRSSIVPFETYEQIDAMLKEKRYRETIEYTATDDCYLSKLVGAALNEASNGYSAMERAVEESADLETTKVLRPLEFLNILGNVAPMIGLFGTVYGMILAFSKLVASGGKPDPAQLAGGISTALVTTFWGLVVAIPALSAYALIRNRVDALTTEGVLMAEELISPFKPGGSKRPPTGGSGAAAAARSKTPPATPKPAAAPAT
jgi:biopolymer transport protein ExbB